MQREGLGDGERDGGSDDGRGAEGLSQRPALSSAGDPGGEYGGGLEAGAAVRADAPGAEGSVALGSPIAAEVLQVPILLGRVHEPHEFLVTLGDQFGRWADAHQNTAYRGDPPTLGERIWNCSSGQSACRWRPAVHPEHGPIIHTLPALLSCMRRLLLDSANIGVPAADTSARPCTVAPHAAESYTHMHPPMAGLLHRRAGQASMACSLHFHDITILQLTVCSPHSHKPFLPVRLIS